MADLDTLIVFPTTHLTLSAEKSLDEAGISYRTVMKPRKISSDCGLVIRIDADSLDDSRKALIKDGFRQARFFRQSHGQWECLEEL